MKTYTEKEIDSQFENIKKFLKKKDSLLKDVLNLSVEDFDGVLFVGCGSSYHIGLYAKALFGRRFSVPAQAIPGGEILLSPETHLWKEKKYLVFLISRSGESTETVKAGELLRENYNTTIVSITTEPKSSLTKIGDISIVLDDAREESVVMTQSFTIMITLFLVLFRQWKGENILSEEIVEEAKIFFNNKKEEIKAILSEREFNHFVFLGQDYAYGLSLEGALKIKEMAIEFSEGFHSLEYRHGPKSIVTHESLIFISPLFTEQEKKLAEELTSLGAKVVFMGEEWGIPKGIESDFLYLFWLPVFHELGLQRALNKGINPDNPKNLSKVVRLN